MNYYKAQLNKDFEYIAGLFSPINNEFMVGKEKTADDIKNNGKVNYILETEDKKIGWFNLKQIKDIVIFGMIIDKPFQNKGYGQLTLEIIEKEAKNLGAKKVKLNVFEDNTIARRIYQKAGFKEIRKEVVMEKDLK